MQDAVERVIEQEKADKSTLVVLVLAWMAYGGIQTFVSYRRDQDVNIPDCRCAKYFVLSSTSVFTYRTGL